MKILSDWYKKFEVYSFWDKESLTGGIIPLFSFSIDAQISEPRPYAYFDTNDTNRWRYVFVSLCLSRYQIRMYLPFKKLPDFVPTSKAMLRTRSVGGANVAKNKNGSKKV